MNIITQQKCLGMLALHDAPIDGSLCNKRKNGNK